MAKIDFVPFLKLQKMCFCTFEIVLFSYFRAQKGMMKRKNGLGTYSIKSQQVSKKNELWTSKIFVI